MKIKNVEDVYSLSPMQQGMLFHSLYSPDSGMYFEQLSCTLNGDLNISAFQRAWQRVVERHPVLRTAFIWEGLDEVLQVVRQEVQVPWEQHDWRGLSPVEQREELKYFLQAERERGFDLSVAPLMHLTLIQVDENTYHFIWSYHHLLLDGWCLSLLFKEVFALYKAFSRGQDLHLERSRPYRDYIAWLQQQNLSQAEAFWRQVLKGFTAPTPLVVGKAVANLSNQQQSYDEQQIQLTAAATQALQSFAQQHQLTLNTLVQGAWVLLLNRYSGQEDVVFGATVSGRPADLAGVESMVGLFINTLPVRVAVSPQAHLIQWLQQLQARQAELRQYEYSSLVQVQGWSEVPRGLPLFESIVVFENYPIDASLQQGGSLEFRNVRALERTNYPVTLVAESGSQLSLQLSYDCRRFDADTINRMLLHFQILLEGIIADSHQRLVDLPLLTATEHQQLLVEWNDTGVDYPKDACIHQLFESQVERTPEAVAVVFGEQQLTYRQLNERANSLAHYLRSLGVGPDILVAICMERSVEMVVGLLGILKAGGAYVPLDPAYPSERLAFMLEDTQASVLLTQQHLVEKLPQHQAHVVCLDSEWEEIASYSQHNPTTKVLANNLAYAIYTSGSTGTPKGVEIQHSGLVNLVCWHQRVYSVTPADRATQLAGPAFDASVWEIWPYLTAGASLHIPDEAIRISATKLLEWLAVKGITICFMPTPLAEVILEQPCPEELALRYLLTGGDKLHRAPGKACSFSLVNHYGPTENTVVTTCATVAAATPTEISPPIGTAIANTQVYLLDGQMQPVPVGVAGEMYIGGVGLARGYHQRPDLTAEKFIPNPFSHTPGARLYKTGDLARYSLNGEIEYLGRSDEQVKLRGFRIELGEIEAVLSQHPSVQQSLVILREDVPGNKRLVAYVVVKETPAATIPQMQQFLQQRLPEYMVPTAIMLLEALPLTPNGKIDRRALPVPNTVRAEGSEGFVAPRIPVEELLAQIWAEVLGVEVVGIHDNFFELGGHSLLATQVFSRLPDAFGVELPLRCLFESPTVAGLAEHIEAARHTKLSSLPTVPLMHVERSSKLPLSYAQARLWFLEQLEPGSSAYNIPAAVRLSGTLHVAALEHSLKEIIRRHEILRTTFAMVDGEPIQVIAPTSTLTLPVVDLSNLSPQQQPAQVQQLAHAEAMQPFDLNRSPLLRVTLLQLDQTEHVLLLVMHHIVSDGWSVGVLIRELVALYSAFSTGQPSPLPELTIQYADFAHWQRQWLQGEVLQAQLSYWQRQLAGAPPVLELPTDRPRPAIASYRGASQSVVIPKPLSQKLQALSQRCGVTLFMTLLAAFQTLLYRYTGQQDICVGSPIANRNRSETEQLIGFFVNTLVLRTQLEGNLSFQKLLARVREVTLGAYAHQDLPFEQLVEALQPERSLSHQPLFQVMFALQNAPMPELELPGLTLNSLEIDIATAKFDLTLSLSESEQGLVGSLEYNTDLFEADTITRMLLHFQILLEGIVADPQQRLLDLPMLTATERQQLLVEWNHTQVDYPKDVCIHQLFEAQVEQTPDTVAVVFGDEQLTYRQLNERANQVAHYLRSLSVKADTLVGICVDRSLLMAIGLLGILKAGGAYVPLDPAYPSERLAFMLNDSQASVLVTTQQMLTALPDRSTQVVQLDGDWAAIAQMNTMNPNSQVTAKHLAYVIYTSGSTGQPKGVLIAHQGLVNHCVAVTKQYGLQSSDRILQFSSISFDIAVEELFPAWSIGATVVLRSEDMVGSSTNLLKVIAQQQLTVLNLPTAYWHQWVHSLCLFNQPLPEMLRLVVVGGEKASPTTFAAWSQLVGAQHIRWLNGYGPTETTVTATLYEPQKQPVNQELTVELPIGRPIANTQIYLLDRHLQPVPVGVPGELYIGGAGLARGYLNHPHLSAEKFIPHPFSDTPGARLYKTGDLARYLPDGNIEYLDRSDDQVKLRGFRIELGEIEAVLSQHPSVQQSLVMLREDVPGNKRLVAYVVVKATPAPTIPQLQQFLKQKLPEYMVPTAIMLLETLPLTPNGKVDRRALPAPDMARQEGQIAPRTPVEELLAQIWAQVLGVEVVGIHDNFFELGGDSILSIQIVARANQAGVSLSAKQLFQHQTIASLATVVGSSQVLPAQQGLVTGEVILTPIQRWFFEQKLPQAHHWNQSMLLEVQQRLDLALLQQAVQQLLVHHDALRLRFVQSASGWRQVNDLPDQVVPCTQVNLSALSQTEQTTKIEAKAAEVQASLNLESGPLMRVVLFDLGAYQKQRLLWVIHHLVVDGVSWRILLEDLQTAYQQLSQGQAIVLPPKTTSFQDWASALSDYAQSTALAPELDYWLDSKSVVVPLPVDYAAYLDANTVASTSNVSFSLSSIQTQTLLQEVPKAYHTQMNDVLLTALVQTFAQWTGTSSLLVDLEGHGREEILEAVDVSRTVGWFTTVFPVRLELKQAANPGSALKAIKEQLRRIPNHGIGYGLLRYLRKDAQLAEQLQSLPQAEVSFNYLGQFDSVLSPDAMFAPAKESSGSEHSHLASRSHLLEVNAFLLGGQLQVDWIYSSNLHQRATIESLAENFMTAIASLIAHCQSPEAGGYTPSDFPAARLSQKDIDKFITKISQTNRRKSK
jgi:amino acid adenylation domain-containing protein/non-ribosomal peptide synthase protein (TIGR01720 family)